jgi:hypothetical protein
MSTATTLEAPSNGGVAVANRYHVGAEVSGLLDTTRTFHLACIIARRALRLGERDVTIYDSMARRGRPELWAVEGQAGLRVVRSRKAEGQE